MPPRLSLAFLGALALMLSGCIQSEFDLTIEVNGAGRVVGSAGGIDCRRAFSASSNPGVCIFHGTETIGETLEATPAAGATFLRWKYDVTDDCTGSTCAESPPNNTFTTEGTTAFLPLEAYPSHPQIHVTATFTAP